MNTRLQVEHPVTEEITGLDLVREQIRVAEGEPLFVRQDEPGASTGHAIEARALRRGPGERFPPGDRHGARLGAGPGVLPARFESGIETGSDVSVHFDPMLAKVIVHAPHAHGGGAAAGERARAAAAAMA